MKTKAAVLHQINKPLKIEELDLPRLKRGQALIKVAYSGICHSQINEIKGLRGKDLYLSHTLGHEGSGIVIETHPDTQKVKVDDRVVLTWIKGSGLDVPSTIYEGKNQSKVNSGAISTFMNYAIISENRLVWIPKTMPLKIASLLGCAVSTGAGIIINTIRMKPGNILAIFGAGGVGLSAIMASRLMHASMIIVIDVLVDKLKRALEVGATHVINAQRQNVSETIFKITEDYGVDYAIETAGNREAMETAFQVAHISDGLCILAGNLPYGEQICLDPFSLIQGKCLIGSNGGETDPDRDIPMYVELYLKQKFNLDKIITHIYDLDNINRALEILHEGKAGRVLIDMDI